jgi:hypothetical protein
VKEKNWGDCLFNCTVKHCSPDLPRAKSLVETAHDRVNLIEKITDKNCNFVFEDYYTSITECIQASAFLHGFNILNHVCMGYYVRDVLAQDDLHLIFDDLRFKRNSLTYYGRKMDFGKATDALVRV